MTSWMNFYGQLRFHPNPEKTTRNRAGFIHKVTMNEGKRRRGHGMKSEKPEADNS